MLGDTGAKKTRYHTIDDIPDRLVPQYSKRDPENLVYKTRRWVDFKKKQILFQQQDGIPIYLRTRTAKVLYYGFWASSCGLLFFNMYRWGNKSK